MKPTAHRLHLLAVTLLLSACAGSQTFKEGNALLDAGQVDQGLAKLEQASRDDPHNAEYRIVLLNRKLKLVNAMNSRADTLRLKGQAAEAGALYEQALAIDPANLVARQGKAMLAQDQRHQQTMGEAEALLQRGGDANLAQAQELLRPLLVERPNQRDLLRLKTQINDAQTRLRPASGRLAMAYRKPVTLEFRDAPLRAVFDFISKVSGLNFVFDRDVDPNLRATISVRDTSIEEAIGMLLSANQLEQSITGDRSITIYPNNPQKQKDYQQLLVRSFFLANSDVKTVAFSLKTLLKARDIVTDERIGTIIMRDTPEMIRMAERIIAVQDVADPEVMLEVEVLEVKRSRIQELGVRWPDTVGLTLLGSGQYGSLNVGDLHKISGSTIGLGFGTVSINANKNDTDSNILANPRIRVRNKDKAKVLIGDRVPVITVTTNNGVSSDSVNYVDVGLKLDVEPNVYLDDEVAIKINLEVSSVVKEIVSKSGTQAYQIGTRSAATVLRLKDGETQVLAGLISDEDRTTANKVPGVGELPVLSRLFGTQKDDSTRSEIVLSITPRVLRSIRRPELSAAEFNSGTETDIGGRSQMGTTLAAVPDTAADMAPTPRDAAPALAPGGSAMTGGSGMTGGAGAAGGDATSAPPSKPQPVNPLPYTPPKKGQ
ncbi:secretin and TonB N-terminal domain-containing protein [Duganella vulcania]|uniref:General secretion pathway protein GspD n=1 Tax=Duganella vulcania TaxID=2692166 RepID=A0A845GP49_9BURK|nr:secretin and TonB N-terminal domain-containing protein [Duganella vulcania]MYM96323.1 general secretion pathway protein GspD [Duganella vulcania]